MKQIRIKKLHIKNFKGIEAFDLSMNGTGAAIYGENATGKSTVADAFSWLLFGKDSLNQANFEIKPIGKSGVEVSVEAVLEVGGSETSLKKVYSEKWSKKRGSAKAEFTGHQVDHFIDGVPSKKKEFDAAIANICPEDLFKLLTSPRFFNEVLHWQDRRKALLEISGDITDTDVIASDKALAKLPAMLGKHSLDDYRKIIKAKLPEINREIQKIPVRIDEITASRVEPEHGIEALQASLKDLKGQRKGLSDQLLQIENGGEIASLSKQVAEIDTQIIAMCNEADEGTRKAQAAQDAKRRELVAAVHRAEDAFATTDRERATVQVQIDNTEARIVEMAAKMESLRTEWHDSNGQQFDGGETCPTCHQALPHERVQATQEAYNAAKARMLADISAKGHRSKEQADAKRVEVEALQERLAIIDSELPDLFKARETAAAALKAHDEAPAKQASADTQALVAEKQALEQRISEIKAGASNGAAAVLAEIEQIDAQTDRHQGELLGIEANKRIAARVDELKKQERELAAEYERYEGELHLTEQFVRAKVALLEDKINAKFTIVRWKLFNALINGGLEETCIMTVDGVPYGSLNNAMRINAGIECCNVLSEHYGIALPCFADNAESVTDLTPSVGQQIRLVVSAADKELRVA